MILFLNLSIYRGRHRPISGETNKMKCYLSSGYNMWIRLFIIQQHEKDLMSAIIVVIVNRSVNDVNISWCHTRVLCNTRQRLYAELTTHSLLSENVPFGQIVLIYLFPSQPVLAYFWTWQTKWVGPLVPEYMFALYKKSSKTPWAFRRAPKETSLDVYSIWLK